MEAEKSSEAPKASCQPDEETIYIRVPNPFFVVRSAQKFFSHPVFNHFRNAQVELMRGVRDVVDYEIKMAEKQAAEAASARAAAHPSEAGA